MTEDKNLIDQFQDKRSAIEIIKLLIELEKIDPKEFYYSGN